MKSFDFDKIINRTNTNSIKHDFCERRGMPKGLLPMWVADTEFDVPYFVQDAIKKRAEHGIFGYSEPTDSYFEVLKAWNERRYGFSPKKEWHINVPGIVFALSLAIKAFTNVGESVLIQPPVYYPFRGTILENDRKLVNNPLVLNKKTMQYEIDFSDFEKKIVENNVKLFVLCSPHNPVGRVWTQDELKKMGEICLKHKVLVFSDEIHIDYVYAGCKHHVFSTVCDSFSKSTILATAPSKTFNIAGLQFSDIFIACPNLKAKYEKEFRKSGYDQLNCFGIVAAQASYEKGDSYVDEMVKYLYKNVELIDSFLKENLPKVKLIKPESTYLAWLDFSEYGLPQDALNNIIIKKGGLWLSSGTVFGNEGLGFMRMNFGCPKSTLIEALQKLKTALAV